MLCLPLQATCSHTDRRTSNRGRSRASCMGWEATCKQRTACQCQPAGLQARDSLQAPTDLQPRLHPTPTPTDPTDLRLHPTPTVTAGHMPGSCCRCPHACWQCARGPAPAAAAVLRPPTHSPQQARDGHGVSQPLRGRHDGVVQVHREQDAGPVLEHARQASGQRRREPDDLEHHKVEA